MSLKIIFPERDSIDKVINFFNHEQNHKPQWNNRLREEFEWLFFNGTYKPSLYAIATDSETDEIVGTYAGIFIPMLSLSGEPIMTLKGEDTLLSLDRMIKFGKRDILKDLLHTLEEKSKTDNVRFIWGFTMAKAAFKRCGFKVICQIKGSFYIINPFKFYQIRIKQFPQISFIKKFLLLGFSFYNYVVQKLSSVQFSQIRCEQISFAEIDEKILLSFLPRNVYTTYLNLEFLKWRVLDNVSKMTYGFLEFKNKDSTIIAYFVFSHNKENIYYVEQFLFGEYLSDRLKIQIMKLAFNFCKKQQAIMIRALGFSHNKLNIKEMELMKKTGFYFFNNPAGSNFIFKNLADSEVNPEDIYLSRLNTQGVI